MFAPLNQAALTAFGVDPVMFKTFCEPERPALTHQCWEHGCNGRTFSSLHNLLSHQRDQQPSRPRWTTSSCGAEYRRSATRGLHTVVNSPAVVVKHPQRHVSPIGVPAKSPTSVSCAERLTQIVEAMSAAHISDNRASALAAQDVTDHVAAVLPTRSSNLTVGHQRPQMCGSRSTTRTNKSKQSSRSSCPRCGTRFPRPSARTLHLVSGRCVAKKGKNATGPACSRNAKGPSRISKSRPLQQPTVRFARLVEEVQMTRRRRGAISIDPLPLPTSTVMTQSLLSAPEHAILQACAEDGPPMEVEIIVGDADQSAASACPHCCAVFPNTAERNQHFVGSRCPTLMKKHSRSASWDCNAQETASISSACQASPGTAACVQSTSMAVGEVFEDAAMDVDLFASVSREIRAATWSPELLDRWS